MSFYFTGITTGTLERAVSELLDDTDQNNPPTDGDDIIISHRSLRPKDDQEKSLKDSAEKYFWKKAEPKGDFWKKENAQGDFWKKEKQQEDFWKKSSTTDQEKPFWRKALGGEMPVGFFAKRGEVEAKPEFWKKDDVDHLKRSMKDVSIYCCTNVCTPDMLSGICSYL